MTKNRILEYRGLTGKPPNESVALREREQEGEEWRRQAKIVRLRWFSLVIAVMLLIAIGPTWYARGQQSLAESRALAAWTSNSPNEASVGTKRSNDIRPEEFT